MDIQLTDTELFELKELLFRLSVDLEEGMQECRGGIQRTQQLPDSGLISTSDHQEHMKVVQQALDERCAQLVSHEKKFQDGEHQMRRSQEEVKVQHLKTESEMQMDLPPGVQVAMESRLAQIQETLRKPQTQYSQRDSVKNAQAIGTYLSQVHTMVTELHHRQEATSSSTPVRPRVTKLSAAARKGDVRVEVDSPEACRIGEVFLIGEQEAKTVINKGSLIFRFPLERNYPEGTVVRPLEDNEFLQAEGDRLCVNRRGPDDDIHFICYVDLMRSTPERAGPTDEAQDQAYAEDLDERIQRIIDARVAARMTGQGDGGVMVPPLSSAHEWERPPRTSATDLPDFGHGGGGEAHQEGAGESERVRRSPHR